MPIGSVAAGLIGQAGANAGGQAGANSAWQGATSAQNILQDQQKRNRVDTSPYTATGRNALNEIGRLMGWGQLETQGGDDLWRWSTDPNGGTQAGGTTAPDASRINALANVVPTPKFNELAVSDKFEADPGYQFRLSEGQKALDRSAASRGMLLSGAQVKGSTDYNQGMASQEYGNWWNRYTGATNANNAARQQDYGNKYGAYTNVLNMLTGMAGQGQSAATGTASMNSGLAGQTANAFANAGNAAGNYLFQGNMQGANALASGIGSGINNAMTLGYMGWGGSNPIFGRKSGYDPTNGGVV